MMPIPPTKPTSASPPTKAAVAVLDERMRTRSKSRLYLRNSPASRAMMGRDCETAMAEWMPTSLSAAQTARDEEPTIRRQQPAIQKLRMGQSPEHGSKLGHLYS